jgi:uncharacterized protein YqgC (DUF456 family)
MDMLVALLISVTAIIMLALSLVGLPGAWIMVAIASVLTFYVDASHTYSMRLPTFFAILAIAVFGEILEFIAGAAGVSKLGGSRRSAALAIVGSITGAIIGLFIGTPVPVIGSVIVSLLLGGAGAFAGAVLGERWVGQEWDVAILIGKAAFWGRLLGTLGKVTCSGTIMSVLIGAAWIHY